MAITVSPSNSPQSAKLLFNVRMMLPLSYLVDTKLSIASKTWALLFPLHFYPGR